MQEVIINVGVSGSGKSTWTTNFIKNNPGYLRINRDDLRKTLVGDLTGYYNRKDNGVLEAIVTKLENNIGEAALLRDYNIIIDNTNLSIKTINEKIKAIDKFNKHYGTTVQFSFRIFPLSDHWTLKARINERDKFPNLDYIDKQLRALPVIIDFLEASHSTKIVYDK